MGDDIAGEILGRIALCALTFAVGYWLGTLGRGR